MRAKFIRLSSMASIRHPLLQNMLAWGSATRWMELAQGQVGNGGGSKDYCSELLESKVNASLFRKTWSRAAKALRERRTEAKSFGGCSADSTQASAAHRCT